MPLNIDSHLCSVTCITFTLRRVGDKHFIETFFRGSYSSGYAAPTRYLVRGSQSESEAKLESTHRVRVSEKQASASSVSSLPISVGRNHPGQRCLNMSVRGRLLVPASNSPVRDNLVGWCVESLSSRRTSCRPIQRVWRAFCSSFTRFVLHTFETWFPGPVLAFR